MNKRNRVGPKINPWGTHDFTSAKSDRPVSLVMACFRNVK